MLSIIQWIPPLVNWNPSISSNIDEGLLACDTMESISEDHHFQTQQIVHQQKMNQPAANQRAELPVCHYRKTIRQEIREKNVIRIRRDTGCAQTTQVKLDELRREGRENERLIGDSSAHFERFHSASSPDLCLSSVLAVPALVDTPDRLIVQACRR